jgi:hypothetical protein
VVSFLAMMAISRWPIISSVADRTGNIVVRLLFDLVEKRPIFVGTIISAPSASAQAIATLILRQDEWNYVQVITQDVVTNPCCCCCC